MKISDWLDEKEAGHQDVSGIDLPEDMSYDDVPDETIYFEEINPHGILCKESHPFSTVERFGHWYISRGRSKENGDHTSKPEWRFFTRDKELALQTAKAHMEKE